ncbi:nuclear transport factor 2 family protein [Pulveribacter sp.]|uniref:nuclear transport factor 2 family protein n=1 Tax=Pulveribacter sp. TaxID=2678893 RepID=UPI0028B17708|nr:nuclear transport factor 2 family protein [Pulveribacter sp.]
MRPSPDRQAGTATQSQHACTVAATQRLIALYERLSPADLPMLGQYYAVDARFKDPFNDVRGVPAITQVFAHMFETLEQARFVVTRHMVESDQAFLAWELHFRMRRWRPGLDQRIQGASLVRFNAEGRVADHRDYWDAAEELYEKLPVLGALMRWLRARAGAATHAAARVR